MSETTMPNNPHATFTRAQNVPVLLGAPKIEAIEDLEFSPRGMGGGAGSKFAPFVDAAAALPKSGSNYVRVPVEQVDEKSTGRALTALRRVIRDGLGKAGDGNDLKCKALANGDVAIFRKV